MARCSHCKNKIEKGKEKRVGLKTIHEECFDALITATIKKVQKKRKTVFKPKTSPLKLTQDIFNKFIRIRDTIDGIGYCISCGAKIILGTKNCQAGHYQSVGTRSDLRFNEDNCHAQCLKCNHFGGKEVWIKYRANLIPKIGMHKVHELEDKSLIVKQDYSDFALKKLRKEYSLKIKELSTGPCNV